MKRVRKRGIIFLMILVGVISIIPVHSMAAESVAANERKDLTEKWETTEAGSEADGIKPAEQEDNPVYDNLQRKIQNEWNKGLENIEEAEVIQITGNPGERLLRTITASLYRNLKNIKAGALLIGACSFCIGIIVAVSARKNKKARRFAVVALITVIPVSLFIMTFCVAVLISIFA